MDSTDHTPESLARLCLDLLEAERDFGAPLTSFAAPDTCVRLVGTSPCLDDGAVAVEAEWRNRRPTSGHERLAFAEISTWTERMVGRFLPILNGIAAHLNTLSPGMRALVAAGEPGAAVALYALVSPKGTPTFRYALGASHWKAKTRSLGEGVGSANLAALVECARLSGQGLDTGDTWIVVSAQDNQLRKTQVRADTGTGALLWAAATQDHSLLRDLRAHTVARVDPTAPDAAKAHVQAHIARLFPR